MSGNLAGSFRGNTMFYEMDCSLLPSIQLADRTIIDPPYVHRRRKANEYILYLIIKGAMYLEEGGKKLELVPGDMYILDPTYEHVGTRASWCEYYYIHFTHPALSKLQDEKTILWNRLAKKRRKALQSNKYSLDPYEDTKLYLPRYYHLANYSSLLRVSELFDEARKSNENQMEYYKILCGCKILEAFIQISRSYTSTKVFTQAQSLPKSYPVVQELLSFLNEEYTKKITSNLLEEKFNRNFDYMNRVFKQITGTTIFRYLTRVRINRAEMLLQNTTLTMAEIGEQSGFSDEFYFSRVFKKKTGESPTGYLKNSMKTDLSQRQSNNVYIEENS